MRLRHQWNVVGKNDEREPIYKCLLCGTTRERRFNGRSRRTGKNFASVGEMETVWKFTDGSQTVQSVVPPCKKVEDE
jgi:hypothetical protein